MLPPSEFSNGSTARSAFHCSVASNAFSNCSQGHGSQFGYAVSAAASLYAPGMPWYATRMPFFGSTDCDGSAEGSTAPAAACAAPRDVPCFFDAR